MLASTVLLHRLISLLPTSLKILATAFQPLATSIEVELIFALTIESALVERVFAIECVPLGSTIRSTPHPLPISLITLPLPEVFLLPALPLSIDIAVDVSILVGHLDLRLSR